MVPRNLQPQTTKALLVAILSMAATAGAELVYQEGFNTDGEAATPKRYTFTGRDVYEVPRIQADLANYDQKGPLYWAHNFEVSFVGNPNIPGRRALYAWRSDPNGGAATEDLLMLWDSMVAWLTSNKTNLTVVVHPNAASINELAARMTAMGHTVLDDDAAVLDEQGVAGDLFIHGPGSTNPSRFAMVTNAVIVINEPDYDDMLVGSIGSLVTFDPGPVTIAAVGHPAAGGKTGSFTGFNNIQQPFGLVGSFAAPGATTLATVRRVVTPSFSSIADVDAAIAGTKLALASSNTVPDVDFSDGSPGQWFVDNTLPGDYIGNWGLRVQGKLTVSTAGTYRVALGSDDGAILQIDRDQNGFTTADTVLDDPGPHGHQIVYADVTFAASGTYDLEVRSYNSGGGGSLEVSVSNVEAPVPDDALDSGYWELLSENGTGPLKLEGAAQITAYQATGPDVEIETPLAVLLNGPNDTPPGSFYDGGAFTGFEGTGFIGASGLNKWPYPDAAIYRTVQLAPINVAGKTNVQLTIALAATVVDFETSDLLDIVVYTNGVTSNPTTLAHFRGVVGAVQPWLADEKENFARRLTKQFADFTYDVPAGATDLVVEIQAATTWWTEIAAFDNIRITAGGASTGTPTLAITRSGANVQVTFANGTLQRATALASPTQWQDVTATGGTHSEPVSTSDRAFFRVRQ